MKKSHCKAAFLLAVVLMAGLLLSACTQFGGTIKNYGEDSGDGYWKMEYDYFDGYIQKEIILENTRETEISISVINTSGDITVSARGKHEIYYNEDEFSDHSSITFYVENEERLLIRVDAKGHEGGFSVRWV